MLQTIILILAALVSSIISGTMGMGGGIILLAFMAAFFPPLVLIPLHGIVQFASNLTRTLLSYDSIVWSITLPFAIASLPAAYLASRLVIEIPQSTFKVFLGFFILLMTWMPKLKNAPKIKGKFFILGFVATFISLFIGATGPFLAPFYLREGLVKEKLVATKAACQLFLHFFKVCAYLQIGFHVQEHASILFGLIAMVVLGNAIGKKLLKKISDNSFVLALKIILSLLALQIIVKALL